MVNIMSNWFTRLFKRHDWRAHAAETRAAEIAKLEADTAERLAMDAEATAEHAAKCQAHTDKCNAEQLIERVKRHRTKGLK
jgi:hypothetical protein